MEIKVPRWQYWGMIGATAIAILLFGVPGAMRVLETGLLSGQGSIERAEDGLSRLSAVVEGVSRESGKVVEKVGDLRQTVAGHEIQISRNSEDIREIRNRLLSLEREAVRIRTRLRGETDQ